MMSGRLTLTACASMLLLCQCLRHVVSEAVSLRCALESAFCDDEAQSSHDGHSLLVVKSDTTLGSTTMKTVVKQHQRRSLKLAEEFATAAKAMPEGSTTRSLLESFAICGQCESFKRFGEANDGGYLMCMDGLQKGSVNAAYSLGVEHHDQWSQDVVNNLQIKVNQFDCTVDRSDCQGCQFFKKCIVSADGQHPVPGHDGEGWSMEQALAETAQAKATEGSLLMKMDIESSEWPIYASEKPEVLRKFGELIVEFHNLEDVTRHQEYLQGMKHILDAGFKVAHLHGNNYGGMYQVNGASIPQVLEVTFIHGGARPAGCSKSQLYDDKLDAPNNMQHPELPMAQLSFENPS